MLLLFLYLHGFHQITGSWQGVLTQKNDNGTTSNYAVWFDLETNGNKISGSYRSEQANTPYYKVSEINGVVEGNNVTLKENKIIELGQIWSGVL